MAQSESQVRDLFERFLQLPTGELEAVLTGAADLVAGALSADKVDAFMFDDQRRSLVALGTSHQPLSQLQKQSGLDVLPLANGGRSVEVYTSGQPWLDVDVQRDTGELIGVRQTLEVQSQVAVRLEVAGEPRGVLSVTSQQPSRWSEQTVRFVQAVARWVGILVHRSELLVQREKSARAEERSLAAEELITVLAHDLRNYLGPIHLRLTAVRRRAESSGRDDDVRDVQLAARSVSRMEDVISDLLDVARLEHGLFDLVREPIELVTLVEDIASTMASTTGSVVVQAQGPVHVSVDVDRVRQCIENLVANALKHCPEGKAVTMTVSQRGGARRFAEVEVIDEGQGIPSQLLPHIFERYVRGRRTSGMAGLGLGLFLAKHIATVHGGDLTVESEPGHGARFTLCLPLSE